MADFTLSFTILAYPATGKLTVTAFVGRDGEAHLGISEVIDLKASEPFDAIVDIDCRLAVAWLIRGCKLLQPDLTIDPEVSKAFPQSIDHRVSKVEASLLKAIGEAS